MENELIELGLGNYEAKALNLLLSKKLNLRQISDKTNIPFGKVYSVIKSLKEKDFVQETKTRPKLIYVENPSIVISPLIEKKQSRDKKITSKLKQYVSEIDKSRGNKGVFFQIGTTIEENKEIQLRTFNEAKEEVLQILNIHHKPKSNRKSKTLWEKSITDATKRGVIFKSIYPKNIVLPTILEKLNKNKPDKLQVKRFDTDFVRCDIIDNDKVLIKLVQQDPIQFGGVFFIQDENLNDNLRKIFFELWEQAEN